MALKKCEDCGKKYSDRAEVCPHCACPNDDLKVVPTEIIPTKPKKKKGIAMLITIILLAIIAGILSFVTIGFSTSDYYFYNTNPFNYKDLLLQGLIMVGVNIIILIVSIIILIRLFLKHEKLYKKFIVIITMLAIIVSSSMYIPKYVYAKILNYDASVKRLVDEGYSLEEAKRLKEEIFDILFGSLPNKYHEEFIQYATIDYINNENNIFTFSDYYNGFGVNIIIENNKVKDAYWDFNEDIKLYFVKDGKKTELSDYYMKVHLIEYTENFIYDLKMAVEYDIKKMLKSPSTAEFSYQLYYDRSTTLHYYKVSVDSQNGFGAMVRTDFRVDLKNTQNEDIEYTINVMK